MLCSAKRELLPTRQRDTSIWCSACLNCSHSLLAVVKKSVFRDFDEVLVISGMAASYAWSNYCYISSLDQKLLLIRWCLIPPCVFFFP